MQAPRLAINQISTPCWSMAEAIDGYARAGAGGIGIRRDALDAFGTARTRRRLRDAGLWVASLCTSAWLNERSQADFKAATAKNVHLLEQAAEIGAPCLVMVVGGLPAGTKDISRQRQRVREALRELLPHARDNGVRLGLEPLHPMYAGDRSVLSTLRQANDLCDELGVGTSIVADVYHSWWDPEFEAELRRAGPARIATFHYSDWLVPMRSMRDRGMVGDGVIDIARIRASLDEIGYEGPFELELLSELDWWKRDPAETTRIGVERCLPFVGPLLSGNISWL